MLLIARRYLLSRKSHSVVNIIAWVSLVSLMLPVAAVIVLLSVFNGFGELVERMNCAVDSDLVVVAAEGKVFNASEIDSLALLRTEGVEALSYTTEQLMMVEHKGRNTLLTMRGVDDNYADVVAIDDYVEVGEWRVRLGDLDRIVLGNSAAINLGIRGLSNTKVELYALKTGGLQSVIPTGSYRHNSLKLAGVIFIDQESEERYGYTSRRAVNNLICGEDVATKVVVKLTEGSNVANVKRNIQSIVGEEFKALSREELNPALYNIVRYEKLGVLLICTMVMVLAAFSLLGAVTMLIIEKRGDVVTLRAMGATRREVRRIFMYEGVIIASAAIVLGSLLGVAVTLTQQWFGVVTLPGSSMIVSSYPVRLMASDLVSVVAIALAISVSLCWVTVRKMVKV